MAMRTIIRAFATYDEAVEAIYEVERSGVPDIAVNLISSEADPRLPPDVTGDAAQSPAMIGATAGAVIGGGLGVLVGVGAVNLTWLAPGLTAFGWVAGLLAGAVPGALAGAIIGAILRIGVTNRGAHSVAEALHRGQSVVMVRVDDTLVSAAEAVLDRPRARVSRPDAEPLVRHDSAEERAAIYRREEQIEHGSS